MSDARLNILAKLEASAVLLADLAGCAVRLEGAERAQLLFGNAWPGGGLSAGFWRHLRGSETGRLRDDG